MSRQVRTRAEENPSSVTRAPKRAVCPRGARELLECSLEPSFLLELPTGAILCANRLACEVLRLPCDRLRELRFDQLVPPMAVVDIRQALEDLATGSPDHHTITTTIGAGDEPPTPAEIHLSSFQWGKNHFAVAMIRDMSRVLAAESALRASQEHFHHLLEFTTDGASSLLVGSDGCFELEWITERFSKVLGYPIEKLSTFDSWMDILHPDDRQKVLNQLKKLLAGSVVHVELRLITTAGETRWIDCISHPSVAPETGQVFRVINVLHDITERKRAAVELQQSREFLERLVNAIDDPIFVKDEQHRWILLNDSCVRMMGHPRHELIGKSDYDLFPPEQADVFWDKDTYVLETGRTDTNEEQISWSGGLHTIATKKSLLVDPSGNKRYIVGIIRDITDRVQMEKVVRMHRDHLEELVKQRTVELERQHAQLREAHEELQHLYRMKDEFTAIISHELRTPLVTGLGYLEMLLADRLGYISPQARDKMGVARRNLKRLAGLIDDLLTFYRMTRNSDAYHPALAPLDLAGLYTECMEDYLVRNERPASSVSIEVTEGTPLVLADEEMIRRVVANLLDNVARHAGAHAHARLRATPVGLSKVQVEVIDNGTGMSLDMHRAAFDPFVSSSKLGRGAGLGLAIVKYIINAHNSEVTIDSPGNQGTRITFTLPAVR
ncbi:MAG: PAS domain S-box protein [Bradymonadales bacterium]|nr:PAS domain S-box protein [Bradymonadales bacterium]